MTTRAMKTTLENGVRIVTKQVPHVHSISMGVWVNIGARDESDAESGLSHFIEHMLFKGTAKRSAYQIAKEFDAIGGQTNAFTTMETTCYYAKVMDTHVKTMVEILSDIFLNSVFDNQEIERERPVIFQEIGMVEDNPEEYIHILSGKVFWGDNGLGRSILGTRENITSFDSEILKSFFRTHYQPERIVIAVAGNLVHNRFVDLVGPAFEKIPPGGGIPERNTPASRSLIEIKEKDIEQTHVLLMAKGLSLNDPLRYTFSLLNTLLGGNMSSRLFQQIRERRGLAYAVYSFISSYVDTGMFGAYVGVNPKNALAAIELILEEMDRIKTIRVDDTELRDAKEYTKGSLMLATESVDNQMVRLAQNEINFKKEIPLKTVIDKLDSVTPEDIKALGESLFAERQLALALLGPIADKKPFESILSLKT